MNKIKVKLIIGIGNPGKEYERTRHNAGFLFIDELERLKIKITLAKSQSFMNESGRAVLALMKFYSAKGRSASGGKLKPENILIVHDDIDILWDNFKFSFGRSSAGHKGVESIIKSLKTKNFWRLRIGIQPTLKKHTSADKIILKKFTPAEFKILNQTIKKAISELEQSLSSRE